MDNSAQSSPSVKIKQFNKLLIKKTLVAVIFFKEPNLGWRYVNWLYTYLTTFHVRVLLITTVNKITIIQWNSANIFQVPVAESCAVPNWETKVSVRPTVNTYCAVTVWVRWSPTHTYNTHTHTRSHQWIRKHHFPAISEVFALIRAIYGGGNTRVPCYLLIPKSLWLKAQREE